jgi:aspartyl aminopeptidase
MASANGLVDFIAASPSPFHCVSEAARRLAAADFARVDLGAQFSTLVPGEGGFLTHGGTLIGWRTGHTSPADSGFRLIGAHTDSPNLRIKPTPEYVKEGYVQWGVEVYGGAIVATWADRDLGVCGRVALRDGDKIVERLVRIERPLARIPNLAIHLNREVNEKGLILNKQNHLPPVVGLGDEGTSSLLKDLLAHELDVDADALMSWDLCLHDVHHPTVGGINGEFVFAPRLDNQASCYSAVEALLTMDTDTASTAVIVLFDHEECGSSSDRGAASSMLRNVLARLTHSHPAGSDDGLERACANSFMVSADMAHGIHPNHSDMHDAQHKPALNGGPVIKTNVNMRYATDAVTAARFKRACLTEEVPFQEFVNRTDLACGSTIGPISAAALAIPTVDVGCAMLSMHSIREQAGTRDVAWMSRVMARLLSE